MSDENRNQISMDREEGGRKSGIIMCGDGLRETVREESNGDGIERDSVSGAPAVKCPKLKIQ